MAMAENVNIPIEQIRRYSITKRRLELFSVACCIKCRHSNGVMLNATVRGMKQFLSVGYAKAKRLLEDMRDCDLFVFETNNRVRVSSLQDTTLKHNCKGFAYRGEIVAKIPSGTYSLKEMYKLMQDTLFTFSVNAVEHKDSLLSRHRNNTQGASNQPHAVLTLKKFARVLHSSISSVSRISKRLVEKNVLSKTPAVVIYGVNYRDEEETENILLRYGKRAYTFINRYGRGVIVSPCEYHIADRNVSDSIVNKIYGYCANHSKGEKPLRKGVPYICG